MILSIETSTPVCSVALHQKGELIAFAENRIEKAHSSFLSLMIDQLFQNTETNPNALTAVAISEGPGSYTGLRIGTATAKGICQALDIELISINTLTAMAAQILPFVDQKTLICPMIDARRMEVYTAIYDKNLQSISPIEAKIIDYQSFEEFTSQNNLWFFGNGAQKCIPFFEERNARFVKNITPSAKEIGALASQKFDNQLFENLAYFEPLYLKEFVAKPSKERLIR